MFQSKASALETDIRKRVEDYREFYDGVVAEDKMLDRGFKRDFSDIPLSLSDQLYKLFRRRPRWLRRIMIMSYVPVAHVPKSDYCVFQLPIPAS